MQEKRKSGTIATKYATRTKEKTFKTTTREAKSSYSPVNSKGHHMPKLRHYYTTACGLHEMRLLQRERSNKTEDEERNKNPRKKVVYENSPGSPA